MLQDTSIVAPPDGNETAIEIVLKEFKEDVFDRKKVIVYDPSSQDMGQKDISLEAVPQTRKSLTLRQDLTSDKNSAARGGPDFAVAPAKDCKFVNQTIREYNQIKSKLIQQNRVFRDGKIATLDPATETKSSLIARLLGGSKEAVDIQNKFRRMIEVPQEDFNLQAFKKLSSEVRLRVAKPDTLYEEQLRMNLKHVKKMTCIEDFVEVKPSETEAPTLEQANARRMQEGCDASMLEHPLATGLLAITNEPHFPAIEADASGVQSLGLSVPNEQEE